MKKINIEQIGKSGMHLFHQVYSIAILSEVDMLLNFQLSYTIKFLQAHDHDDKLWRCSKIIPNRQIWGKNEQGPTL